MVLKKLVEHDGQCIQVSYAWYDYVLLPFRVLLLVLLMIILWPATRIAKFMYWLANHPAMQPFDRRGK